jgi:hypothetical protein
MVATFFFIRSLLKRNLVDMALALFGITAMTLTQSASNLVMCIFTILGFTLYVLARTRAKTTLLFLVLSLVGLSLLAWGSGGAMGFFLERLGSDAAWGEMFNRIVSIDLLPYALVGHVSALGDATGAITGDQGGGLTEIGAVRILYELGIIHATVLFLLVFYPVWRWFKIRLWCLTAVPAVAAIVFGFLSLSHYGSLFRSTSVFLFYSFGAICLSHVMNTHRPERMGGMSS